MAAASAGSRGGRCADPTAIVRTAPFISCYPATQSRLTHVADKDAGFRLCAAILYESQPGLEGFASEKSQPWQKPLFGVDAWLFLLEPDGFELQVRCYGAQ